MKKIRPKTIFCDVDGTLVKHYGPADTCRPDHKAELLPGTIEKLLEWDRKGYCIVLVTGRKESLRKQTERQLSEVGIFYDKLIMGIGGGERYVVNDRKPDGREAAFSVSIDRDKGIGSLTEL